MPIDLSSVINASLRGMNEAENAASRSSSSSSGLLNQVMGRARAKAAEDERIISNPYGPTQGQQQFEKEANTAIKLTGGEAANTIKTRMQPVDPVEQMSLMMMLPQEEQDYARVTYNILANRRAMS